jgi:hypothetical protein
MAALKVWQLNIDHAIAMDFAMVMMKTGAY